MKKEKERVQMRETSQIMLKRQPNKSLLLGFQTRGQLFVNLLSERLQKRMEYQSKAQWFIEWKLTSMCIAESFNQSQRS